MAAMDGAGRGHPGPALDDPGLARDIARPQAIKRALQATPRPVA